MSKFMIIKKLSFIFLMTLKSIKKQISGNILKKKTERKKYKK